MSFNSDARRVEDESRPVGQRYGALMWCIESHCWMTGQRFTKTRERLERHLGYGNGVHASPAQLVAALEVLREERERARHLLDAYHQRRREEKGAGRRSPRKGDGRPSLPDGQLVVPLVAEGAA